MQVADCCEQTRDDAAPPAPSELSGLLIIDEMSVQTALRLKPIDQNSTISMQAMPQQGDDVGMGEGG